MLALKLPAGEVGDVPEPERAPGESLVAVRVAGVCDTDLQLSKGYMGFAGVPGHEFVGTVIESDEPAWRGRRVVADINAGCGDCAECRDHRGHHCAQRTVLGILGRSGAFAERLTIPDRCLVAVPDGLSDEVSVFAEPMAAALHVLDALTPGAREQRIVVLGDGKLGTLIALALAAARCDVCLVGHHPDKLAVAARAGVATRLEADAADLRGAPTVVEATGHPSGLALAMGLVAPRGTIVLKTTMAAGSSVDLSPLVIHEVSLVGSRCGDLGAALALLGSGAIDPSPLIAARYPLRDAALAMAHAARKGVAKVLIDCAVR